MSDNWVAAKADFAWEDEDAMWDVLMTLNSTDAIYGYRHCACIQFTSQGEVVHFLFAQPNPTEISCDMTEHWVLIDPCDDLSKLEDWCKLNAPGAEITAFGDALLEFASEEIAQRFERACEDQRHLFKGKPPSLRRVRSENS
jgi:hypothetical protein